MRNVHTQQQNGLLQPMCNGIQTFGGISPAGHRCDCVGHHQRVWSVPTSRTQRRHHTGLVRQRQESPGHQVRRVSTAKIND